MMQQAPGAGAPALNMASATAPTENLRKAALYQKRASKEKEHKATTVFVGGLRKTTDEDKVIAHFSKYGPVESVDVKRLPDGTSRGFGFVKFVSKESVEKVVEARANHMIDNKWVAVTPHGNEHALGGGTSDRAPTRGAKAGRSRPEEPPKPEEEETERDDYEDKWSENYLQVAQQVAQKQQEDGEDEAATPAQE